MIIGGSEVRAPAPVTSGGAINRGKGVNIMKVLLNASWNATTAGCKDDCRSNCDDDCRCYCDGDTSKDDDCTCFAHGCNQD